MNSILYRLALAACVTLALASVGVHGCDAALQTSFAVLGVVFSVSMSLIVSFNLSKVLNSRIRSSIRYEISRVRRALFADFVTATLVMLLALLCPKNLMRPTIMCAVFDISLFAAATIVGSLIYEAVCFKRLHKLSTKIEDAIIDEEVKKRRQ